MDIQEYKNKFDVKPSNQPKERQARQDTIQQIVNFLHWSATEHFCKGIPNNRLLALKKKAEQEGEKPVAFFKYLVSQEKKK